MVAAESHFGFSVRHNGCQRIPPMATGESISSKKAARPFIFWFPSSRKWMMTVKKRWRYTVLAANRCFEWKIQMVSLWIMNRLSCRICHSSSAGSRLGRFLLRQSPATTGIRGYYLSGSKEIALATPGEKCIFFPRAFARRPRTRLTAASKAGQDSLQEIIAELSAQALCRMVGKQTADTTGNSYIYIERYAEKLKLNPYTACLKVMSETEKVLTLILKGDENLKQVSRLGR